MGLKARILVVDDQMYLRSFLEGALAEAPRAEAPVELALL